MRWKIPGVVVTLQRCNDGDCLKERCGFAVGPGRSLFKNNQSDMVIQKQVDSLHGSSVIYTFLEGCHVLQGKSSMWVRRKAIAANVGRIVCGKSNGVFLKTR